MARKADLVGKVVGRLTVLSQASNRRNNSGQSVIYYTCQCSCGNVVEVSSRGLLLKDTQSCGCLRREVTAAKAKQMGTKHGGQNKLPDGVSGFNHLLTKYKKSAAKRGHTFSLTEEEFRSITQQDCFYCGESPSKVEGGRYSVKGYIYNGIDRRNNKIGYTLENSVPCCTDCNIMKGTMTDVQFFEKMSKVLEKHLRSK